MARLSSSPRCGITRATYIVMVQLQVRLVAPETRVQELVHALRAVMRGAQQARGCRFAEICVPIGDPRRVNYVEEWDDEAELRAQFGSERFVRLLALIETAAEPPVMEFRFISKTQGLEYIDSAGSEPSIKSLV